MRGLMTLLAAVPFFACRALADWSEDELTVSVQEEVKICLDFPDEDQIRDVCQQAVDSDGTGSYEKHVRATVFAIRFDDVCDQDDSNDCKPSSVDNCIALINQGNQEGSRSGHGAGVCCWAGAIINKAVIQMSGNCYSGPASGATPGKLLRRMFETA